MPNILILSKQREQKVKVKLQTGGIICNKYDKGLIAVIDNELIRIDTKHPLRLQHITRERIRPALANVQPLATCGYLNLDLN